MVKFPTKLEDLVPPAAFGRVLDALNQPVLASTVREALQRVGIKDANPIEQVQEAWQQARQWVGNVASRFTHPVSGGLHVINATGALFCGELSGFPLAPTVAEAFAAQAMSFQDRSLLEPRAQSALKQLLGAEAAVAVSSLAAAMQLVLGLEHFADGILVSRADLVRIPGFGDARAILATGSSPLHEVGATNGANLEDWSRGIKGSRQAVVLVSPNNLTAADSQRQREAAVSACEARGVTLVELLVDGSFSAGISAALPVPSIKERWRQGSSLIIAPLDGFLGGPSGAVIAGDAALIEGLQEKIDSLGWGLRGAALAATTTACQRAELAATLDLGILDCLQIDLANLKERCRRLAIQLMNTDQIAAAEVIERSVELGPSPWNRYCLTNAAVSAEPKTSLVEIQNSLHELDGGRSIRTTSVQGQLVIDLRFVLPSDDHQIVAALTRETPDSADETAAEADTQANN